MSFWDTFVKVWQVRKSIEIQEGIEGWFRSRQQKRNAEQNYLDIRSEIIEKNRRWKNQINKHRK
jgi:hypothetical protein